MTSSLCPVYIKWLQINPASARDHALAARRYAAEQVSSGQIQPALTMYKEAFEISGCLISRLYTPHTDNRSLMADLALYAVNAASLAYYAARYSRHRLAADSLSSAKQKLRAIAPLFADDMNVVAHIVNLENGLNELADSTPSVSQRCH